MNYFICFNIFYYITPLEAEHYTPQSFSGHGSQQPITVVNHCDMQPSVAYCLFSFVRRQYPLLTGFIIDQLSITPR